MGCRRPGLHSGPWTPSRQWHSGSFDNASLLSPSRQLSLLITLLSTYWVPSSGQESLGPSLILGWREKGCSEAGSTVVPRGAGMLRDFCLKPGAVPRSWAWGSLEGRWESLLGSGQEGFLESAEGASLSPDFCSRGSQVVEGFPLPGVQSPLPSHVGICGLQLGLPPTSPNQPISPTSLPALGSALCRNSPSIVLPPVGV